VSSRTPTSWCHAVLAGRSCTSSTRFRSSRSTTGGSTNTPHSEPRRSRSSRANWRTRHDHDRDGASDNPGLPGVHQGDPSSRLGRDHQAGVDRAIRLRRITKLTVVHDLEGMPKLAVLLSGGMEDTGAGGGWSWVLSGLKTLLETGEPLAASHNPS